MLRLELIDRDVLADAPIPIAVTGWSRDGDTELTVSMHDDEGTRWQATTRHPALRDLLAFLLPDVPDLHRYLAGTQGRNGRPFYRAPRSVTCTAELRCAQGATEQTFLRRFVAAHVRVSSITAPDAVGRLYQPGRDLRRIGVLFLSGSSGGVDELYTPLLASHGYAALACALFNHPGRPPYHECLDIGYVARAACWLLAQKPALRGVVVIGASRGSEAALLGALHFPDAFAGAIAISPGSVVTPGWTPTAQNACPAWTLRGVALPVEAGRLAALPDATRLGSEQRRTMKAIEAAPLYRQIFESTAARRRAGIDLSRLARPLLLLSGADDRMWPAALAGEQLLAGALAGGRCPEAAHVIYEHAGHLFAPAQAVQSLSHEVLHPVERLLYATGGSPAGNASAARESWRVILAFLDRRDREAG